MRVFLVGRDQELNGTMCLFQGKVLLQLKNYTKVLTTRPDPSSIRRDQYIYEVQVRDLLVVKHHTCPPGYSMLWDGPPEGLMWPDRMVQVEVICGG